MRERVDGRPLVALGGGRVIDAAKAIGGADGLPVRRDPDHALGRRDDALPPHAGGRSTAGSSTRPAAGVADPGLMASQPMPGLAASAMNALAHAIEALYTPLANPVAERGGAARRRASSPAGSADEEPDRPRAGARRAAGRLRQRLAGFAVHHIVCQTIVRVCGTPHAQTNAVMLPHFVRMMDATRPQPMARVRARRSERGGRAATGERVAQLARRELGVTRLQRPGEVDADSLDRRPWTAVGSAHALAELAADRRPLRVRRACAAERRLRTGAEPSERPAALQPTTLRTSRAVAPA